MSIEKKSLISTLKTTKKANVASGAAVPTVESGVKTAARAAVRNSARAAVRNSARAASRAALRMGKK
jgi:hypothetical protein